MSSTSRRAFGGLLAALLLGLASAANADSFAIDVGFAGDDLLHLTPDLVEISPGVFLTSDQVVVEGAFRLAWDLALEGDPVISGSFTLTNLSDVTRTFAVSATLGTAPIAAPTLVGGSFGDLVYTDTSGEGIVELATVGATPFYQAEIDGVAVAGLGSFQLGPASGVLAKQSFGTPIPSAPGPGVAASIGVDFAAFTLTAGDQMQTPFELVVAPVPEPASAVLVGLGLGGLLAARSKRRAA